MFWLKGLRKKPQKSNNNSDDNPVSVRGVRRGEKWLFMVDRSRYGAPALATLKVGIGSDQIPIARL
jgi:hypothetical protein